MDEKTALGEERAGDDGKRDDPEREKQKGPLDDEGNGADNEEEHKHGHGARSAPRLRIGAVPVQAMVEPGNDAPHPGDGMAD